MMMRGNPVFNLIYYVHYAINFNKHGYGNFWEYLDIIAILIDSLVYITEIVDFGCFISTVKSLI